MSTYIFSDSDLVVKALNGGIATRVIAHPGRAFAFEVTFYLDHPQLVSLGSQKPPLHFHPYQAEYITVLDGYLGVQVENREIFLDSDASEFCILPWANHRIYPPFGLPQLSLNNADDPNGRGEGGQGVTESPKPATQHQMTRFLLSGQESTNLLKLDKVFFQNWYEYQDQIVLHGKKPDLIQVMSMFDAGGSYLSLPIWIPFSRTVARAAGILIGRWLGGVLGYQPFYRQWTNDELWPVACQKMEQSRLQRYFPICEVSK